MARKVERKPAKIDLGRVLYDEWVRVAGYEKDARVPSYDQQKELFKERWRRVAQHVVDAANGG